MGRQPMTGRDDVETQVIYGDPEILEKKNKAKRDDCPSCTVWTSIIGFALCMTALLAIYHLDTHYYVVIDSVSGLDNPAGRLSFNLTLGVGSWTYGYKACIKPGTYVEVSYRGFQLAASEANTGQLCVGPMKTAEQHIVARVTALPNGQVLDSLAADMKQGVPVLFNVTLNLLGGSYGVLSRKNWVTKCEAKQVGATSAWCDAPDQFPYIVD